MKKNFTSLSVVLALLAAIAAPTFALSPFAGSGNINNQIEQAGEDLDNANATVKKAMKDYRQAAANLPAAEASLKKAKTNLAIAQAADKKASTELKIVSTKADIAEMNLSETQTELGNQKIEVSKLIRSVYRQGPMSELAIVLGSETPMDLTARIVTLSKWTASKQALISSLIKSKEDLAQQTKELATIETEKAKKKASAEAIVLDAQAAAKIAEVAQKKVNEIVAKKASSLKIALKHRDSVKKRYAALKKEQARLKKLAQNAGNIGKDLTDNNDLIWPVTGARVTQYTGPRIHPVYGYRSCHTGIDLGASSGTPIKSAEDGIVAAIQNYDSGPYGKFTLITHGDGLSTFYAHQSSISVDKGDRVKRGEVIGRVGSTGWSTGAHLHFEVRVKGTPYNPMGWFGGSKSKVSCVD